MTKLRSLVCCAGAVFATILIIKTQIFQATSLLKLLPDVSFLDRISVVVRSRTCCTASAAEASGSVTRLCRILNSWVATRSGSYSSMVDGALKMTIARNLEVDKNGAQGLLVVIYDCQPWTVLQHSARP